MFCISLFEKFVPIESPIKIISGQSYRQFAYLELYSSQISGHYHSRVVNFDQKLCIKAHSHDMRLTRAGVADSWIAAKNRQSSIFSHCNSLLQSHASNAACLNEPKDCKLHLTQKVKAKQVSQNLEHSVIEKNICSIDPWPVCHCNRVIVPVGLPAVVSALVVRAHDGRPRVHHHPTFARQRLAVSGIVDRTLVTSLISKRWEVRTLIYTTQAEPLGVPTF